MRDGDVLPEPPKGGTPSLSAATIAPSNPTSGETFCTKPAHCPVCGRSNECRLETGEGYKGRCWCEGPILSATALNRLLGELPEPRCLCRGCLEMIAGEPEISWEALVARRRPAVGELLPGDSYYEGSAMVFTEQYLRRRGYCCENGCRHCPYGGSS
jgi:hypothetical protein